MALFESTKECDIAFITTLFYSGVCRTFFYSTKHSFTSSTKQFGYSFTHLNLSFREVSPTDESCSTFNFRALTLRATFALFLSRHFAAHNLIRRGFCPDRNDSIALGFVNAIPLCSTITRQSSFFFRHWHRAPLRP